MYDSAMGIIAIVVIVGICIWAGVYIVKANKRVNKIFEEAMGQSHEGVEETNDDTEDDPRVG